jgi:hypothetical protein
MLGEHVPVVLRLENLTLDLGDTPFLHDSPRMVVNPYESKSSSAEDAISESKLS